MKTSQLILKLIECLVVISAELVTEGPDKAEGQLRRLQFMWRRERPIELQKNN